MADLRLQIIPEFEKKAIKDFVKDMGSEMKTVDLPKAKGKAGATGEGGGMFAGLGKLLLPLAGITSIVGIVMQFRPLISIVKNISKILVEFLRPIADMVTILLMPLLLIIKPILIVFRQLMAPFRKAALQLAAAGGVALRNKDFGKAASLFGLSFITMFKPLIDLVLQFMGKIMKTAIDAIGFIMKTIPGIADSSVNAAVSSAKGLIDDAMGSIMKLGNQNLEKAAASLGVDIDLSGDFLKKKVESNISEISNSFITFIEKLRAESIRILTGGAGGSSGRFRFDVSGAEALSFGAAGGFSDALNKLARTKIPSLTDVFP